MQSNKIKQAVSIVVAAFAIAGTAHTASATSGSWVSPTAGGNWSTNPNWTGATFPTTGETATLGDVTSGTRTIIYDAAASGLLGTLTLTQTTAGANNVLDVQNSLVVNSAIILGASNGTAQITINPTGILPIGMSATSWTVNSGGALFLRTGTTNAGSSNITNAVTISGGLVTVDGNNLGTSVTSAFSANVSMSSGTLTLANGSDVRAQFDGNFTGTGGAITRTATNAQFVMNGATNSFSGLTTFDTSIIASLNRNGDQSFSSTVALGNLLARGAFATMNKTVTGSTIGQLQFINGLNNGTTNFVLGSNLTTTGTGSNPFAQNFGSQGGSSSGTVNFGINTNGNTLDLTSNATTFTPNTATNTSAIQTNWSFTGAGTIRATNFNLSTLLTQVNVGSGTTLQVMGGNSTAVVLSGGGTINAASTLLYSGNAAIGTPATLTSTRSIGALNIASGAVRINSPGLTAGGLVTVGSNATLDLSANPLIATGLTVNTGNITSPGSLTIVGTGANVLKTGSNSLFLSNSNNSYTGITTIQDGTIFFSGNVPVSSNSALGNSASPIVMGNASSGNTPRIQLFSTTISTFDRAINATAGTSVLTDSNGNNRYRFGADISAGGTMTMNGAITYGSDNLLATGRSLELVAVQSNTFTVFNGLISTSAGAGGFIINGGGSGIGRVTLNNIGNSFAGLTVNNGTLLVGATVAASGNSVLGTAGTINLADGGTPAANWTNTGNALNTGQNSNPAMLTNGAFTVSRSINLSNAAGFTGGNAPTQLGNGVTNSYVIGGNTASNSSLVGNVTVGSTVANKLLNLTQPTGGTFTYTGAISPNADAIGVLNVEINALNGLNSGSYAFSNNAGTVVMSSASTYDGTTIVRQGTLLANNPSGSATGIGAVTVSSGATLGGSGFLGSGGVTINGTISPGNSIGTLTLLGNTSLNGTYLLETDSLGGTDRINVNGALSLGATSFLDLTSGSSLNPALSYLIANYLSLNTSFNTFGSVDSAILSTHSVDYTTGSQITLVPIPEPTTAAVLLGMACLVLRRRSNGL